MSLSVDLFDPDYLGEDLALVEGDLAFDDQGDFVTVSDAANVVASFRRILATPQGSLSRFVYDVDPYRPVITMTRYGNPAYQYLSEPASAALTAQMREAVLQCVDQEERLVLLDLQARFEPGNPGPTLVFDIVYKIRGTADQRFTLLSVNPYTHDLELR